MCCFVLAGLGAEVTSRVSRGVVGQASGVLDAADACCRVAAPLAGGGMVRLAGPASPLLAGICSVGFGVLVLLRRPGPVGPAEGPPSMAEKKKAQ